MQKLLALISTTILIVLGMMFSAVLLVFVVTIGLIVFGYLWWKTRTMRKMMREQHQAMRNAANDDGVFKTEDFKGEIIEGEVIRRVVGIEEMKQ